MAADFTEDKHLFMLASVTYHVKLQEMTLFYSNNAVATEFLCLESIAYLGHKLKKSNH